VSLRNEAQHHRAGFTLMELILALSLAVVLSVMIGTTLSFYVGSMETRDSSVRRVQLATSVMKMISDDLKASLAIAEFDDSALGSFLAASAGDAAGGGGGADQEASEESSSLLFDVPEEASALPEEGVTMDLAIEPTILQRPGLMGNQTQILFDISRTPRLEEFQPMLTDASEGLQDIPSDIKTVSYFVQPPGTGGVIDPLSQVTDGDTAASLNSNGGLVRRQLDRLATKYALESGNMTMLNMTGDLLAPEVLAIEFAYWDGFLWQIKWNSDMMGALPLAIQIRLTIGPPGSDAADFDPTGETNTDIRVFQQTVRLPMGRIVEDDELMADGSLSGVGL